LIGVEVGTEVFGIPEFPREVEVGGVSASFRVDHGEGVRRDGTVPSHRVDVGQLQLEHDELSRRLVVGVLHIIVEASGPARPQLWPGGVLADGIDAPRLGKGRGVSPEDRLGRRRQINVALGHLGFERTDRGEEVGITRRLASGQQGDAHGGGERHDDHEDSNESDDASAHA